MAQHWSQTPEGRRRLSELAKRRHGKKKAGKAAPATTGGSSRFILASDTDFVEVRAASAMDAAYKGLKELGYRVLKQKRA